MGGYSSVPPYRRSGGLAALWDGNKFKLEDCYKEGDFQIMKFIDTESGKSRFVCNVYGPIRDYEKVIFSSDQKRATCSYSSSV